MIMGFLGKHVISSELQAVSYQLLSCLSAQQPQIGLSRRAQYNPA
jgi:hypothetical protein